MFAGRGTGSSNRALSISNVSEKKKGKLGPVHDICHVLAILMS